MLAKKRVIEALEKRARNITSKTIIPFSEIIKAIELLMDSTYFQFNNKYYAQIFFTPMGLPISGLFADIVMEDLKSDCLKKLYFSPMFYFHYFDDILTCIPFDKIDEIYF